MNDQTSPGSQQFFQLIVENVKDYAIFATDLEGRIISWNPGVKRLLGYDEAEIVGQPISIIFTPEDVSEGIHLREMETAAREGCAEDKRWHQRQDGSRFWANGMVMPLKSDGGELHGFAKVMRNDTKHKQLEDELHRQAAALTDANRIKDDFLATLSHELRTPLTSILGWTRMLRDGTLDEAAAARALETIERNARAQTQLIDDLLDVSRIITGKLRLYPRTIELIRIIEAAIDVAQPAAEAKQIHLETKLDAAASLISGDPDRLQQVVWNLLSNAVKFTPNGGSVEVRLARVGSQAVISVSDTGKGIEPEFLPFVFDRFRQADATNTRTHGGLGIGLALVRHIAELHGGTVAADSAGEGQGATFTVKLPMMAVRTATSESLPLQPANSALTLELPQLLEGLRVLVVDDEADARELINAALAQHGATVVAAASARAALEEIEQTKFDVIVSDVGMPDESGHEMMHRLRASEKAGGHFTPAVALTAYAGVEDRMKALLAGFQAHVPKPVELVELVAVVASLAGRTGTI